MRLHTRVVTPGFWGDPDLVEWPRDQRFTYHGLWQLADSAGCLEYSPRLIRGMLWAMDDDITTDMVSYWIDAFVRAGKCIPYVINGKLYLFLKNFHTYQKEKNPSPPECPIPEWVEWHPFPSNDRTGRYIILDEKLHTGLARLTEFLQSSYEVLTEFLQFSSKGREAKGREGKGRESLGAPAPAHAPAAPAPTPSLDGPGDSRIPHDLSRERYPLTHQVVTWLLDNFDRCPYAIATPTTEYARMEQTLARLGEILQKHGTGISVLDALQTKCLKPDLEGGMKTNAAQMLASLKTAVRYALEDAHKTTVKPVTGQSPPEDDRPWGSMPPETPEEKARLDRDMAEIEENKRRHRERMARQRAERGAR